MYGSVLQSTVVIPQVLNVDLSFDNMVTQNFTLLPIHDEFIRKEGVYALKRLDEIRGTGMLEQIDFLRKEIKLGELVRQMNTKDTEVNLLEASPKNRKAIFVESVYRRLYKRILKVSSSS